VTQMCL